MPFSDKHLAVILCFLLALILPIAIFFMPSWVAILVSIYSLTVGVICFTLLT